MTPRCHQRKIRDGKAAADPRPVAPSLDGYTVETITKHDALPLIGEYEWLGNIGKATEFVGLIAPRDLSAKPGKRGEIQGVACFGHGSTGHVGKIIGTPALSLERGACVHWAPKNAASFLINRACKLISRMTGVPLFFAYGDPAAGEYGGVYQAANWLYFGQGVDGKRNRAFRYAVLPPGGDWDKPADWKTTRALRRGPKETWLKFSDLVVVANAEEAKQHENEWRLGQRPGKHLYATNVGRERGKWLKQMAERSQPYPALNPELKLSATEKHFLAAFEPAQASMFE